LRAVLSVQQDYRVLSQDPCADAVDDRKVLLLISFCIGEGDVAIPETKIKLAKQDSSFVDLFRQNHPPNH